MYNRTQLRHEENARHFATYFNLFLSYKETRTIIVTISGELVKSITVDVVKVS